MALPVKNLIIGVIKKDDSILLRKKFAGSKPYKETWYLFGCSPKANENLSQTFISYAKDTLGVKIKFSRNLPKHEETKEDHDKIKKHFIYTAMEFEYISGEPMLPSEHEKIEFININDLGDIDLVPPSVRLFKEIGYF